MKAPSFEIDDDGYPTDDSEAAWEALEPTALSPFDAARFLLRDLPALKNGYGGATVSDGIDDVTSRPLKIVRFVTGGWSGHETIINLILRQFWIRHFHSKWERGGAFWFEIPVQFFQS